MENATKKVKVEFKITELPNDKKMLSFLASELSNSAAYFTAIANVSQSDVYDYKTIFGIPSQHSLRPFSYSKRVKDASKV